MLEQPRNLLGGFITSEKDFLNKQRKINQEGIFSEKIFGPVKSYSCTCGYYSNATIYGGKICPKCEVLCASNSLRESTFGKIKLVFPIIKPNRKDRLTKLIKSKDKLIFDPNKADYSSSVTNYLAIKHDKSKLKIVKRLNDESKYLTIPFRLTGIYSLYIALRFAAEQLNVEPAKKIFENKYLTRTLKVLPPDLRLLSFDASKGQVHTPDINKKYTAILSTNKHNRFLVPNMMYDEDTWISKITSNLRDRNLDQDIVEPAVLDYDIITAKYQHYVNTIYESVYDSLSGKTGLIRNSILGRNIEFSARTVICCDSSLHPYEIKVSKKILKKLWAPYFLYFLTQIKGMDYDICYESLILPGEENPRYNILFDEFLVWFYDETDPKPKDDMDFFSQFT